MTDRWTDRLSEYLDGELGVADAAALEAHLPSCGSCRTTLEELRRVVARAGALDDRPPAADLWPEVATRIGLSPALERGAVRAVRRARRRLSFTVPQLLAASVALVLVSAGSAWVVLRQPAVEATTAATGPAPIMTNVGTYESSPRYAAAVADLERLLAQRRSRLDPTTVRVIEKNLGIIDRAIRDAQSALAADPANAYLNQHLAQAMRRKLELLRQAATLASAQS
jgi:predicted anti-sigma-YlaC factor YlaD